MPKVSIVVPNYNYARFLGERLESIARQTFQDFEVILIDDASTDESPRIMERFAEQHRGRVIVHQQNSGNPFKLWNEGLKLARGQYAWVAESDDYADERFLETLVQRLEQNPQCGVAFCNSLQVDGQSRVHGLVTLDVQDLDRRQWRNDFVIDGHEACCRFLAQQNVIPNASAVVFRRDLYDAVGGVDDSLRLTGDWKFWASALRTSDLAFVAEPLNYFRSHGSTSRSKLKVWTHVDEEFRVMKYILESMPFPAGAVKDVHGRAAVLLLHAMLTDFDGSEFRRCYRLASEFGFRPSFRAASVFSKQVLRAIRRRLTGAASPSS
jgi:glycosyltransferase involved in cell wall biosynthesis